VEKHQLIISTADIGTAG